MAYSVGEPPVVAAIAYEQAGEPVPAAAHHAEQPLVARSVQSTAGLLTGVTVYAIALGGILALLFALLYGRLVPSAGPATTARWLAASGFSVLFLVPFAKYPGSPPGASDSSTIADRTELYAGLLLISAMSAITGALVRRWCAQRLASDHANLVGVAVFVVMMVAAMALLPAVNELPSDFSARTLWDFQAATVAIHLTLWSTLGIGFSLAAERTLRQTPEPIPA